MKGLRSLKMYTYAWTELMLTIVPLLREAMWGMTALHMRIIENTLASYARCISSIGTSIVGPEREIYQKRD